MTEKTSTTLNEKISHSDSDMPSTKFKIKLLSKTKICNGNGTTYRSSSLSSLPFHLD